jgi:hypothetical protein
MESIVTDVRIRIRCALEWRRLPRRQKDIVSMQAFIGKAADKYTVQPANTIYGKRFSSGTRLMPQGLEADQVSGGRAALSTFVVAVRSNAVTYQAAICSV